MADIKITNLPLGTDIADDDELLYIDVSDQTEGPDGTDKRVLIGSLRNIAERNATTEDLIASDLSSLPVGKSITTVGFYESGDGGGAQWVKTADTDTPSQTPAQLGDAKFTDSDGAVWELVAGQSLYYNGSDQYYPSGFGYNGKGFYFYNGERFTMQSKSRPIVILTSGQSNMVGSSNVLEGSTATNELVEAWNARFNQNGTDFTLAQLGQSPFNGGGQQHIGFNAAKYLAETTGREVKIINMADGGQPIEKWLDDDADDYMWQAILREVPLALTAAGVQTIDFFMWHQGEANSSDSVMDYRDKLRQLKVQLEAQEWFDGNAKFIVGGMALGSPTTGTSGARPQQNLAISLFCESDPQAIPVYTGDLITDSTGVHFTDLSIIEIGQRYAKAALSGAGSLNAQPTRYVEAATNLTYDQTNGQFRDFDDLLDFISTLNFKNGARLDIHLPAGTYNIGAQRLNFEGNLVRFIGELDSSFTTPVKADFTGTESTDLTMLQSKYLTELVFTSTNSCFVLDGSNSGYWQDLLLVSESPLFKASFVRNSDPSLFTSGGGSITLSNVAMHGLNGNSCTVIQADKGCYVDASECVVSHCDAVALANSSNVFVKDSIFAYSGQAVNSTNRSFINAFGLELIGQSGVSYVASLGSFVDARSADDNTNKSEATNGIVETT